MAFQALWLQNEDYPARQDRAIADNIWTEGILGAGSLAVAQSSPTGMSVQVAAGVGVVEGDDQAFQGKYLCREQVATTGVTIGAAPGSGQRNDLVVLRVRDPNATGPAGDDAIIQVVAGTPSSSPVDPAVPPTALVLARVRVPAGTGVISNALIDDLRVPAQLAHNVVPTGSVTTSQLATPVAEALAPTGSIMQYGGTTAPSGWLLCDGTAYPSSTYPALSAVLGTAYNTSGGQSAPAAGNFRVPILQGRIGVGLDSAQASFNARGNTGGANQHTLTTSEMPSHTHTQDAHNHTQNAHGHSDSGHGHGGAVLTGDAVHGHDIRARYLSSTIAHNHDASGRVSFAGLGTGWVNDTAVTETASIAHGHGLTINASNVGVIPNTASNNPTTATNQFTGGGSAHNNLQPYIVVNYIIKT
jgi:microcystin-dependent protein